MTLNVDPGRVLQAASALEGIGNDVVASLSKYVTMNQSLNGTGFSGIAALMSVNTSTDVAHTGTQVHNRFQATIDQMRKGVAQYTQVNQDNASALGSVGSTAV